MTNGNAEEKSKERTNCMKKKDVEGRNIKKRRKKENATKIADAKCNDVPTVWNAANEQRPTEDHPLQKCQTTCHWKSQSKT